MGQIGTERVAARVYVTGDSYALKDRLKAAGCHWDAERRQWWVGVAKEAGVQAVLAGESHAGPAAKDDPKSIRLTGKGEYKGRTYYIGASTRDGSRCRLLTLPNDEGQYLDFWADVEAVRVTKTYQPRESGYGRYRRTEYTTLGSIVAFVRRQRDPATARGECTECGHWGPKGEPCDECGGEGTHV